MKSDWKYGGLGSSTEEMAARIGLANSTDLQVEQSLCHTVLHNCKGTQNYAVFTNSGQGISGWEKITWCNLWMLKNFIAGWHAMHDSWIKYENNDDTKTTVLFGTWGSLIHLLTAWSWDTNSCTATQSDFPSILWSTKFTRAHHWPLFWNRWFKSMPIPLL